MRCAHQFPADLNNHSSFEKVNRVLLNQHVNYFYI